MPADVNSRLPDFYFEVRSIFLEPNVTDNYSITKGDLEEEGLYKFLCEERSFSMQRVETVIERMKRAQNQKNLSDWFRRVK